MSAIRELPRFSVPGSCIMFPGRRRDERGFYMFDQVLDGAKGDIVVGISGEGLRTIAEKHGERFGIIKREKYDEAVTLSLELKNMIQEQEAELEELRAFKERVSGLTADGFKIVRRQGRLPKKEEDQA